MTVIKYYILLACLSISSATNAAKRLRESDQEHPPIKQQKLLESDDKSLDIDEIALEAFDAPPGGNYLTIPYDYLRYSVTLKKMVRDYPLDKDDPKINLWNITHETLSVLVECWDHMDQEDERSLAECIDDLMEEDLHELMVAAYYLDSDHLLTCCIERWIAINKSEDIINAYKSDDVFHSSMIWNSELPPGLPSLVVQKTFLFTCLNRFMDEMIDGDIELRDSNGYSEDIIDILVNAQEALTRISVHQYHLLDIMICDLARRSANFILPQRPHVLRNIYMSLPAGIKDFIKFVEAHMDEFHGYLEKYDLTDCFY